MTSQTPSNYPIGLPKEPCLGAPPVESQGGSPLFTPFCPVRGLRLSRPMVPLVMSLGVRSLPRSRAGILHALATASFTHSKASYWSLFPLAPPPRRKLPGASASSSSSPLVWCPLRPFPRTSMHRTPFFASPRSPSLSHLPSPFRPLPLHRKSSRSLVRVRCEGSTGTMN